MSTITLTLPEDQMEQLRAEAARREMSVEEFVQGSLTPLIGELIQRMGRMDRPLGALERPGLEEAIEYVLTKNAELHRRLAR